MESQKDADELKKDAVEGKREGDELKEDADEFKNGSKKDVEEEEILMTPRRMLMGLRRTPVLASLPFVKCLYTAIGAESVSVGCCLLLPLAIFSAHCATLRNIPLSQARVILSTSH